MPIATLTNLSIAFGTDQILDHIELTIESGERIALAGRNGAGKSTLLNIISGSISADDGSVWRADNLKFSTLSQDLPKREDISVFDSISSVFYEIGSYLTEYNSLIQQPSTDSKCMQRLAELQELLDHLDGWNISYRVEAIAQRLELELDSLLSSLSGGWLKRVAIAQSLVLDPDVWILDEPTNHLDLEGIKWLESLLLDFPGTVLFVTHDRQMMESVATAVIEIDRGALTRYNCNYKTFIDRRDTAREIELEQNKQFDNKLKIEEAWIRQGIKARRTRNEGRVRALKALREERSKRSSLKDLKLEVDSGIRSGKIVKEASALSKSIDETVIIKELDLIIQRGDRIGIIGPNGCGKTTLIKLLLGEIPSDSGRLKTGTKLEVAYFDQIREQLDQQDTVKNYIAEGRDLITINDKNMHVVSYLNNFMFNPDQARAPIHTLSGGEQNRLMLAKLFSLPTNLLVLDEPTNDLDIESLELLEELLIGYNGTVIIVSHDRLFMDNVVSSLLVFEGTGIIKEHVGGYSDWVVKVNSEAKNKSISPKKKLAASEHKEHKKQKATTQKQIRDLDKLTTLIEETEKKIAELTTKMGEPSFFEQAREQQKTLYDQAIELDRQLAALMHEWEILESD